MLFYLGLPLFWLATFGNQSVDLWCLLLGWFLCVKSYKIFSHKNKKISYTFLKNISYTFLTKPTFSKQKTISYYYHKNSFSKKQIQMLVWKTNFLYLVKKLKVIHSRCILNMTLVLIVLSKLNKLRVKGGVFALLISFDLTTIWYFSFDLIHAVSFFWKPSVA